MRLLNSAITIFLTLALLSSISLATTALTFEADDYWVELEIGYDEAPVVASIRVHLPGDNAGVLLHADEFWVDVFDPSQQKLVLRYTGEHSKLSAFTLTVQDNVATLIYDRHTIVSSFNWSR